MSSLIPAPIPATPKQQTSPLEKIETHYRKFLASRWLEFTWRAAVWTGISFGGSLFVLSGFNLSTLPLAFCIGILVFPVTVYPILWSRRSIITSPPKASSATTLRTLVLVKLFDSKTLQLLGLYASFGAIFSTVYCLTLSWRKPSVELGFYNPTPRHPWHLNERYLFLVFGNTALLITLGLRDVYGGHLRAVWPRKKLPFSQAVQNILSNSIPPVEQWFITSNPLTISLAWSGLYTFGYLSVRARIWHFLLTHFTGIFRPFIINFVRSSRNTITWSLLPHLVFLEGATLLVLQLPVTAMMAYITQPLKYSSFTAKSPLPADRYLLIALRSQNPYFINFTLMELVRVCRLPARRKVLFDDVSSTPSLTTEMWQELLRHLDNAHSTLVTRGGTRSLSPAPAQPTGQAPPDPRAIPIKQADIFRPVTKKKSTIQAIVGNVLEGPANPPPTPVPVALLKMSEKAKGLEVLALERARAIEIKAVEGAQKVIKDQLESPTVGPAVEEVKKNVSGVLDVLHQGLSGIFEEPYYGVIPNQQQIQWIVDIIAVWSVASTEEDTYGNVQQILPQTFDTLIKLRQAVLGYHSELTSIATSVGPARKLGIIQSQMRVDELLSSINGAIRRICGKFGESMEAFRLSPGVSGALAEICR